MRGDRVCGRRRGGILTCPRPYLTRPERTGDATDGSFVPLGVDGLSGAVDRAGLPQMTTPPTVSHDAVTSAAGATGRGEGGVSQMPTRPRAGEQSRRVHNVALRCRRDAEVGGEVAEDSLGVQLWDVGYWYPSRQATAPMIYVKSPNRHGAQQAQRQHQGAGERRTTRGSAVTGLFSTTPRNTGSYHGGAIIRQCLR